MGYSIVRKGYGLVAECRVISKGTEYEKAILQVCAVTDFYRNQGYSSHMGAQTSRCDIYPGLYERLREHWAGNCSSGQIRLYRCHLRLLEAADAAQRRKDALR